MSQHKPLLGISLLLLCGLGALVAVGLLVGSEHRRSAGGRAAAVPGLPLPNNGVGGAARSPMVQATWARHYFRRPACRRAAMGLCPNGMPGPGALPAAAALPPACATCPNAAACLPGATPAAATLPPGCATCPNAAACLPPTIGPGTPAALGVAMGVPWAAKNPFVALEPPLNTVNNCASCPQQF